MKPSALTPLTPKPRRHYDGCYRWTMSREVFGQIKRQGKKWAAEVRLIETGALVRYAGIWPTLRGAVEELCSLEPAARQAAGFIAEAVESFPEHPKQRLQRLWTTPRLPDRVKGDKGSVKKWPHFIPPSGVDRLADAIESALDEMKVHDPANTNGALAYGIAHRLPDFTITIKDDDDA